MLSISASTNIGNMPKNFGIVIVRLQRMNLTFQRKTWPIMTFNKAQLTGWADNCLNINHPNTRVQRKLKPGNTSRVFDISERARKKLGQYSPK